MRSTLSKAVRKHFDARLKEVLPHFKKRKVINLPSGVRLYAWHAAHELWFYLLLVLSPKDDSFTIEVAGSETGDFPSHLLPSSPEQSRGSHDFRFRISTMRTIPAADHWWMLCRERTLEELFLPEDPVEECMQKVIPTVDEAIEQVEEYVVPFLVGMTHDTA